MSPPARVSVENRTLLMNTCSWRIPGFPFVTVSVEFWPPTSAMDVSAEPAALAVRSIAGSQRVALRAMSDAATTTDLPTPVGNFTAVTVVEPNVPGANVLVEVETLVERRTFTVRRPDRP